VSPVFDCTDPASRGEGVSAAAEAIFRGECVVLPTDTVYGIAADAFNPTAVAQLLEAKGRGRDMPPPVLIPSRQTVDGLAMSVPSYAGRLMDAFWPGGLTLVFRAQQSLAWDLGDTNGTVGLRMPNDEIALALLESTGPLAVSSANRTGKPSATTVTDAGFMLGHFVDIYLDGGPRGSDAPSTILDCTKADPVVLREGAVSNEQLQKILGDVELITGRAINSPVDEPMDEPVHPAAGVPADGVPADEPVDLDEPGDDETATLDELADGPDDATALNPADDNDIRSSADAPDAPPTLGEQWDESSPTTTSDDE
jgi:L-threonylcarbamoyladenylate synthase